MTWQRRRTESSIAPISIPDGTPSMPVGRTRRHGGGTKGAGNMPNLVDDDISVDSVAVDAVESQVMRDVQEGLHLDKHKDARELTTMEAGMLYLEQASEAGNASGHASPVPELDRQLLQRKVDDMTIGEGEGIAPDIVGKDLDGAIPHIHWASAQSHTMLRLPLEHDEDSAHGASGEPDGRDAKLLPEDALEPWQEGRFRMGDVDKAD